jgi:organic radical activating enzyme
VRSNGEKEKEMTMKTKEKELKVAEPTTATNAEVARLTGEKGPEVAPEGLVTMTETQAVAETLRPATAGVPEKGPAAYSLASQGVYPCVLGEGLLAGLPAVLIRLGGCSVGCPQCDTDHRVVERATAAEIARRVEGVKTAGVKWCWVSGGEPTDHNLCSLLAELRRTGLLIAVATAGTRDLDKLWPAKGDGVGIDFLSVSPHSPNRFVQRRGDEIRLVFGLNGLTPADAERMVKGGMWFGSYEVSPLAGSKESVDQCVKWVNEHPTAPQWRMGCQRHVAWGLP